MSLQPPAGRGIISTVKPMETGRFLFTSADGFSQSELWAKRPVLPDQRPAVGLTPSAVVRGALRFRAGGEFVFGKRKYYVYVIESSSGHYKIGYSNNYKRRLAELKKTQGPFEYRFAGAWQLDSEHDARRVEKALHDEFADKRANGEWFELKTMDLILIGHIALITIQALREQKNG